MNYPDNYQLCNNCGVSGPGKYCSSCGNSYRVKRITVPGIIHDIFHFFTHLDKGFGYTLKRLITAPGVMQREYVDGVRAKHQKPFSMFFICATVTALVRYWLNIALIDYYNSGSITEGNFFHEYMVLLHSALLPLYALITFAFFYQSRYNYAETVILLLYSMGFFLLITDLVAMLRLIWPRMNTDYIELAILLAYNIATNINFFNQHNKWVVAIKSIATMVLLYVIANFAQDIVIDFIKH